MAPLAAEVAIETNGLRVSIRAQTLPAASELDLAVSTNDASAESAADLAAALGEAAPPLLHRALQAAEVALLKSDARRLQDDIDRFAGSSQAPSVNNTPGA